MFRMINMILSKVFGHKTEKAGQKWMKRNQSRMIKNGFEERTHSLKKRKHIQSI